MQRTANIFKIERLNTHNGPGFRTVIYFKGCPLHCTWCHNPESLSQKKQVWLNARTCIGCGICVNTCKHNALSFDNNKVKINQKSCTGCLECSTKCPTGAIEPIGKDYTVDSLMRLILQDKHLYEMSGGGVTVTGGEPGLYAEFISELFKQCKNYGIQTAFDTSGCIPMSRLKAVIASTDLLFLDLKIYNEENSIRYTGLKMKDLKENIDWLKQQEVNRAIKLEFRTPLVPGITDGIENLQAFANDIVSQFPGAVWELCMFNDLCEDKYIKLGVPWKHTGKKYGQSDHSRIIHFCEQHPNISFRLSGILEDYSTFNKLPV